MSQRLPWLRARALVRFFSAAVAVAALGCSGESDTDSDADEETGGSNTGGSSGSSGSSGSGGTSGTGGVAPECELDVGPIDPTAIVDDIEDGNPLIAMVGTRNGSWWVTGDGTAEGTITPPSDAAPPPERILGGRCESEFAMRVTGQGFTRWGANLSIGFRYVSAQEPVDVSDFSGVMFWARVGETHNSPIRVQFHDMNTHPEGGVCDPTPEVPEQCYDGWGTELAPIGTSWRLYKIDFSRMAQQGFGHQADALDPSSLFSMDWSVREGTVFDLWIDDVWFYE